MVVSLFFKIFFMFYQYDTQIYSILFFVHTFLSLCFENFILFGNITIFRRNNLRITNVTDRIVFIDSLNIFLQALQLYVEPHLGGSVVSVWDSRPGSCEFDPQLRQLFFPAYFHLSPLQKHVRKVVGGFGKKGWVSTFLSSIFSPLTSAEACEKSSRWLWKEKLC